MTRVFLSAASEDRPAMRRLAEALREAGHEPLMDVDEAVAGEPLMAGIARGLESSDIAVIGYSKAAERSRFLWPEIEALRATHGARPIVVARFDHTSVPPELRDVEVFDLRSDSWERQLARLARRVAEPARTVPPNNLPARSTTFVDREADLSWLEQHLGDGEPVALVGIAGIGKSVLAIEYAHRSAARYPGGQWWLRAGETPSDTYAVLASVLRERAKPAQRDRVAQAAHSHAHDDLARVALDTLSSQTEPALVIVDEVIGDTAPWLDWLPRGRSRLLLTMRSRPAVFPGAVHEVVHFSHEDALRLFEEVAGPAEEPSQLAERDRIVAASGGHPLTVHLIAALNPVGTASPEATIEESIARWIAVALPLGSPARRMLEGTLPFAPGEVPVAGAAAAGGIESDIDLEELAQRLEQQVLARFGPDRDTIMVHPTVSAILRAWVSTETMVAMRERAAKFLAVHLPTGVTDEAEFDALLLRHVRTLAGVDADASPGDPWSVLLQVFLAEYQYNLGDVTGAARMLEQAEGNVVTYRATSPGQYAMATARIASLAHKQGDRGRAERMLAASLEALEADSSSDPGMMFYVYMEAGSISRQQDMDRAATFYERAAMIAPDVAGVARALAGLSEVLVAHGDIAGAAEVFKRALEVALAAPKVEPGLIPRIAWNLGIALALLSDLTGARVVFSTLEREAGGDAVIRAHAVLALAATTLALGELNAAAEILAEHDAALRADVEGTAESRAAIAAVASVASTRTPERLAAARAAIDRPPVLGIVVHLLRRALAAIPIEAPDGGALSALEPAVGPGEQVLRRALVVGQGREVNPAAYEEALSGAIATSESADDPANAARAAFLLADFYGRRGGWERAQPIGEQALRLARRATEPLLIALAYRLLADVALHGSRYEDARQCYEEAIRRFDGAKAEELAAISRVLYVNLLLQLNRRAPAATHAEFLRDYLGRASEAWPYREEAEQTLRLFDRFAAEIHG